MNVRTRLACGFALIVLALVLVAILSHFTVRGMLREGVVTTEDLAMTTELTQREVDHLVWVAKVRDFIDDEQASQLAVETDHQKCGFGKWYYGESARQLGERFPALAPLLNGWKNPIADCTNRRSPSARGKNPGPLSSTASRPLRPWPRCSPCSGRCGMNSRKRWSSAGWIPAAVFRTVPG
jgi:hypothetical protein